jgi:hypothetical protein
MSGGESEGQATNAPMMTVGIALLHPPYSLLSIEKDRRFIDAISIA